MNLQHATAGAAVSTSGAGLGYRDPSLARPVAERAGWQEIDVRAVDTARLLAADAVQKAGSGHPGTAMSLAPLAYLLFQNVLVHDPADEQWLGRDRFVLSAGHTSLTLYIQLFLSGYGLEIGDLEALRTWGSKTPGHPEYRHTRGVEITTGPLGQGLAAAVGMAMAARRERGLLDPEAPAGESPFDHHVYVIVSDGDMMEGVSSEASSLAGHQELGSLIVFYDQNHISIEDDTGVSFSEDVAARYAAYGWHVQIVDWRRQGRYTEDVDALLDAITTARRETGRPSMIVLNTIIGWPAPTKQNTGKAHGAALGSDEVARDQEAARLRPRAVLHRRGAGAPACPRSGRPGPRRTRRLAGPLRGVAPGEPRPGGPAGPAPGPAAAGELVHALPSFEPDPRGMATRKASGEVLSALAPVLPELWGGSADLAESNNTTMDGADSFVPSRRQTKEWRGGPYGRTLHFGIREHAMAAALNGIALQSLTRAYGGTFLTFSDYMRPAVRLAALMQLPAIYVWTHDSIGLGEDGPTHQPVEHLASLRNIPGLDVVRPGDANETSICWRTIIEHTSRPAGIVLSRQNIPVLDRGNATGYAAAEGAARGGYILAEAAGGKPAVVLIGTGSEVQVALDARDQLQADGIAARVVSMPCVEWFAAQDPAYRDTVLPPGLRARVSVEAGITSGWEKIIGDAGRSVGVEHYGASADYQTLYRQFGITADAVAAAARDSIHDAQHGTRPGGHPATFAPNTVLSRETRR